MSPYLCASSENNSVSSYITYDSKYLDEGNCIFIGGKTFIVSYQDRDFFSNDSHNLALYLKNKSKRTKKIQTFLAACIQKSLSYKYSWGDSVSNKKIQKDIVLLPAKNGDIDFDFMETFVAEIESERIEKLESYLLAADLKDHTLTKEEEKIIQDFENIAFDWKQFEIQTLFNVAPSKAYKLNDSKILNANGKTPYVSNQSQDNGYIGWSDLAPLNQANVITLSDTWQSERTIFYQPKEFIGKSHLQVLNPYDKKFQKHELFFAISSFRKAILQMNYDYGTKFNRDKIKTTKIQLPILNNKIDFISMKTFITAIQKLVIKDVITYTAKKYI